MRKENFLLSIRNSIGSQLFRNYHVDGKDVLQNGDLSCAYYVSAILLLHNLIDKAHFTVNGTIFAMEKIGWFKVNRLKPGCVIVWGPVKENGNEHKHIGFYVGDQQAISNRSSLGMPGEHQLHYTGLDKDGAKKKAPVVAIYWHPYLT